MGASLREVSRRALAAGDLERPQQKRSPKRESGGDGVAGGGPGARLLGCQKAIRRTVDGRTSRCLHDPLGWLGEAPQGCAPSAPCY